MIFSMIVYDFSHTSVWKHAKKSHTFVWDIYDYFLQLPTDIVDIGKVSKEGESVEHFINIASVEKLILSYKK